MPPRDTTSGLPGDHAPKKEINSMFRITYKMVRNINVTFHYMGKDLMRIIITRMIRPKLEYAATAWSPHQKKCISKLESRKISNKNGPKFSRLNI